jgi:hypothetical protein
MNALAAQQAEHLNPMHDNDTRNAMKSMVKRVCAMKIKARLPAVFIPKDHPLAVSCVRAVEQVLHETPDVRRYHMSHHLSSTSTD